MCDVRGGLENLRRQLRAIKFKHEVKFQWMAQGKLEAYVDFYRHLMCDHNPALTRYLNENGFSLFGIADNHFMEVVFRIARTLLNLRIPLTIVQFNTNGFAQKKLELAANIVSHLSRLVQIGKPVLSDRYSVVKRDISCPDNGQLARSSATGRVPLLTRLAGRSDPKCWTLPYVPLHGSANQMVDPLTDPSDDGHTYEAVCKQQRPPVCSKEPLDNTLAGDTVTSVGDREYANSRDDLYGQFVSTKQYHLPPAQECAVNQVGSTSSTDYPSMFGHNERVRDCRLAAHQGITSNDTCTDRWNSSQRMMQFSTSPYREPTLCWASRNPPLPSDVAQPRSVLGSPSIHTPVAEYMGQEAVHQVLHSLSSLTDKVNIMLTRMSHLETSLNRTSHGTANDRDRKRLSTQGSAHISLVVPSNGKVRSCSSSRQPIAKQSPRDSGLHEVDGETSSSHQVPHSQKTQPTKRFTMPSTRLKLNRQQTGSHNSTNQPTVSHSLKSLGTPCNLPNGVSDAPYEFGQPKQAVRSPHSGCYEICDRVAGNSSSSVHCGSTASNHPVRSVTDGTASTFQLSATGNRGLSSDMRHGPQPVVCRQMNAEPSPKESELAQLSSALTYQQQVDRITAMLAETQDLLGKQQGQLSGMVDSTA